MDNKMTAEQALDTQKASDCIEVLRAALSAPRVPAMWLTAKDGEHFPKIGGHYLVRHKGSLLHEVFVFDQGDDGNGGGGEHFWNHGSYHECPAFDFASDEWLDISLLAASPEPKRYKDAEAGLMNEIIGLESAVRTARALPHPHNIPVSAGMIIEVADRIADLRAEVEALKALESALAEFEAETEALPLGHESKSNGASTYNWRVRMVAELREKAARLREGGDQ